MKIVFNSFFSSIQWKRKHFSVKDADVTDAAYTDVAVVADVIANVVVVVVDDADLLI